MNLGDDPNLPVGGDALVALASDPLARMQFGPLSARPYLLIDADAPLSGGGRAINSFLRDLPCPSIARTSRGGPLAEACDVVVADARAQEAVVATIQRNPQASSALVQVLRAVESLAIPEALAVESFAYATLQAGPEFRSWLEQQEPALHTLSDDPGPPVLIARGSDELSIELNRESSHNAMSVEMRDALVEALQLALTDDSIARIVISGRGKCFSTGGDLAEFGTAPDPATAHAIRTLSIPGRLLAACESRAEVRVHGACIGSGIEFPAFAGRVVATPSAWFQLPEVGMGLIPGAGGCVSLSRRMGRQRVAWMALTGSRIKAETALSWRLVNEIVAEESLS